MYEMLSGRRAFEGDTAPETMAAILNAEPGPPSSFNSAVPRVLDRIALRCLEKQPGLRFQSARDIAFAIEAVSGFSSGDSPDAAVPGTTPPRSNGRRWTGVRAESAVALLAIGAIAGRLFFSPSLSAPRVTRLTFERGMVSNGQSGIFSRRRHGPSVRADVFVARRPECPACGGSEQRVCPQGLRLRGQRHRPLV